MPAHSETRIIEMIFPDQANHYGTLFGGNALPLMAKAAFVAATRHAGCPVVMARSESVNFATQIRLGEMLELSAEVTRTGRGSMTVAVVGNALPVSGSARRAALTGKFEMVAVDGDGRPQPIARNCFNEGQTE
ncbi:acyl-CoA thioesterase [Paracoccus kondratievae]|uniref:acyl-CoA thioesterase n=1 Tax=Paracoccus kondratievae TaxID=135740 RepID=UPI0012663E20|nr:acyl-CoA thioesterase [Paracoccus kondratievae]QFQ88779.1 acyl-CoA thioesterase [Paracoccus kondratievae]